MESRSPLAACQAARSHAVRGDAPDQATGLEAAEIADPKAREGRKAVGLVEADPGPSSQGPHQRARKAVSSTFQGHVTAAWQRENAQAEYNLAIECRAKKIQDLKLLVEMLREDCAEDPNDDASKGEFKKARGRLKAVLAEPAPEPPTAADVSRIDYADSSSELDDEDSASTKDGEAGPSTHARAPKGPRLHDRPRSNPGLVAARAVDMRVCKYRGASGRHAPGSRSLPLRQRRLLLLPRPSARPTI